MSPDVFLQITLSGLTTGAVYAIVALGFVIIFKVSGVINLAQGEFVALGGLSMVTFQVNLGWPLPVAFVASVLLVTAVGAVMERLAISPARRSRRTPMARILIITIGVSTFLKGVGSLIWGKDIFYLPPFSGNKPIQILGATILPQHMWILGSIALIAIILALLFGRTNIGKAMLATAENPDAASLMGINVNMMVLASFALGAALGAVAGLLVAPVTFTAYDKGTIIGLKGFVAAAMGGMGNSTWAVGGGLILGLAEAFSTLAGLSELKDATSFMFLIVILFMMSRGMLGKARI
ncbi:MAG: branched-chain amino acid ABC transporter permease [Chloroflexi bacterium]|nr:branched-chain amino acid ABC transporter permease [Chloroflexota bacterium]